MLSGEQMRPGAGFGPAAPFPHGRPLGHQLQPQRDSAVELQIRGSDRSGCGEQACGTPQLVPPTSSGMAMVERRPRSSITPRSSHGSCSSQPVRNGVCVAERAECHGGQSTVDMLQCGAVGRVPTRAAVTRPALLRGFVHSRGPTEVIMHAFGTRWVDRRCQD